MRQDFLPDPLFYQDMSAKCQSFKMKVNYVVVFLKIFARAPTKKSGVITIILEVSIVVKFGKLGICANETN